MIKERSGSSLDKKGVTHRGPRIEGGFQQFWGELMTLGHSQQFDYHAPGRGGYLWRGREGGGEGRYFQTNANK